MDLGLSGRLPKIFTEEDLIWLRNYLNEHGDSPQGKPYRKQLSNFHRNLWNPVNDLLMEKFYPVIGDEFKFCYALANMAVKHDDVIHTDICLRHSTLPKKMMLPKDKEERIYYTFLVIEDYDMSVSSHKPRTYLFDKEYRSLENTAPDFVTKDDFDLSLPTYEVSEETKFHLEQLPIELVSRLKILDVLEQEPFCVNYWQSYIYHTQDAFVNRGVKWKKFFNIMASKKK